MPSEALEAKFKCIVACVADTLKSDGFRKSGTRFRREREGNLQLFEFQRSSWNDRNCLRFTANIGVLSGKVLKKLDPDAAMQKQTEIDAHLRKRLGEFRDQQVDYWWEIADSTDELLIADEIKQLISGRVLPFLAEHSNDSALAKLWARERVLGQPNFSDADI